jgi:Acetyltransferase (isoleucine patch superfamily)
MALTEKEKMCAGEAYNASEAELTRERMRAHDLCHALSQIKPSDLEAKDVLVRELLPNLGEGAFITAPFFCDYGWNITTGKRFYCNTGCVILDCAPVHMGDNVLLAPNVQIYTATHALDPDERAALGEWAKSVRIGNNVWIGGNATICPGVSIGDGTVIGAGSVVTKDIPAGVIAGGNPCRIIRKI